MSRHRSHLALASLAALAALAGGAGVASAKQSRYVGVHPQPKGKGTCFIDAPHVHAYAPSKGDVRYRTRAGVNVFVGDPVPYGYDGERSAYVGHHPLHVDVEVGGPTVVVEDPEYCYLDGPHFHAWGPPAEAHFELKTDAYWYVGTMPPRYQSDRRRYAEINAVYEPLVYVRPVVVIAEAPVGWFGAVVVAPAPVVEAEVHAPVVRAGLEVHVPVPTIEVGFGIGGGVIVDDHHHHDTVIVHDHRHKPGKRKGHYKRKGRGHW
jgi:hypothetical protein